MDEPEIDRVNFKPLAGIDRLIHEPARLLIMATLYVVEAADFLFLERQTGLTRGNLSSHLIKLESGHYVEIKKEFIHKKPHTMLRLTAAGKEAFNNYRSRMQDVLDELPE